MKQETSERAFVIPAREPSHSAPTIRLPCVSRHAPSVPTFG